MRCVRSGRLGAGFVGGGTAQAAPGLADLQARRKSFEVAFLLVGKVD